MQGKDEQRTMQNALAERNRSCFSQAGVFVLNILASPDSGKTSVIVALIDELRDEFNIAVIAGDISSSRDFARVNRQGIAAVQVDVGDARCLDGAMVANAANMLDLENLDLVFLENSGSLVFPADFDLGENAKVTMLSISDGDNKPLEYPDIFKGSQAIVLNKVDTLSTSSFDMRAFRDAMMQVNPSASVFPLSATTGQGVEAFAEWLADQIRFVQ